MKQNFFIDTESGNVMMLNIERFRRHLKIESANPKKAGKTADCAYFANLLGADGPTYSKWINKDHTVIRESGGNAGISPDKLLGLLNYFNKYKVGILWLFSFGTESEFNSKFDCKE